MASQVLPLQREGGGRNSFSHAEGGHTLFCSSFDAVHFSFSHTEGRHKKSPHHTKVLPCLEGMRKSFRTSNFLIL